jgi:hypothetical protein
MRSALIPLAIDENAAQVSIPRATATPFTYSCERYKPSNVTEEVMPTMTISTDRG